ncbi:MAG: hypothetical protein ABI664_05380 [bacterium]
MTTPRIRSLVSLAAVLVVTLTVGGCASASHAAPGALSSTEEAPATIRFDNDARDYVHVYLVGARQEWMLGRVAPGARATLRIPDAALTDDSGAMQLAVLVGQRMPLRARGEPRAELTIAASATAILLQRWTFTPLLSRGQQLTSFPVGRPR